MNVTAELISMSGERNLQKLLQSLNPTLNEGDYVFCLLIDDTSLDRANVLFTFKEKEGTTVVLSKEIADQLDMKYSSLYSWVTLDVHSALDSVGLTARVSAALANGHISCNVVAAFHHDHLFIPKRDVGQALNILRALSNQKRSGTTF